MGSSPIPPIERQNMQEATNFPELSEELSELFLPLGLIITQRPVSSDRLHQVHIRLRLLKPLVEVANLREHPDFLGLRLNSCSQGKVYNYPFSIFPFPLKTDIDLLIQVSLHLQEKLDGPKEGHSVEVLREKIKEAVGKLVKYGLAYNR